MSFPTLASSTLAGRIGSTESSSSNFPSDGDLYGRPAAIGKGLGAVHNAIEYSIVVGDLSGYVINAGLMGAFRDRNPGLGGDSFPPLIALSHSCCNAKVMVDSMELKAKRDGDGTGTGGRDGSGFCYHSCMEANNRGDC